jgi:plastocyanin
LGAKRILLATAVLVALFILGGMKHPFQHTHLGVNQAPQAPVVATGPRVTVEIRGFDFFPRDLTVRTGAAVTWTNRDEAPHDATDLAGAWASGLLKQDQSDTIVFDSPGVYQYHCTIHPNMQATLKVLDRLAGERLQE